MTGEREAADLQRFLGASDGYAAHYWNPDGTGMATGANIPPQSLTKALFGPYTCTKCCSYLHNEADHGRG